jgi:WD40 repeat protein
MGGLIGTILMPDLTPVAAEAEAAEGDPRPVYTWSSVPRPWHFTGRDVLCSFTPSDEGAPRLVAVLSGVDLLGVWDTGTGAFLQALQGPDESIVWSLVTYQRPSDGRPKVAAGAEGGRLCIWDGDNFQLVHEIVASAEGRAVLCLAVYEDPASGSTRLVTG